MIQEVFTWTTVALKCMPLQAMQQASSSACPRRCFLAWRLFSACRLSLADCRTGGNSWNMAGLHNGMQFGLTPWL